MCFKRTRISTCSDDELKMAVLTSFSYTEVLNKLGYRHTGGAFITLKKRIAKLNISIKHMTHRSRKQHRFYTNKEVFIKDSSFNGDLRKRVLDDNLIVYKCAICGLEPFWNNKVLTLTLDHINGNHYDNRIENLRFVCPNCDSQLETYGSKNKISYDENHLNKSHNMPPIKYIKQKQEKYCIYCGKEININSKMCRSCFDKKHHERSIFRKVSKQDFYNELKTFTSFVELGKRFGVSDNAIRKWCKIYNLPTKTKDMNKYIKTNLFPDSLIGRTTDFGSVD